MRRRDAIEAITGAVVKCLCNEGLLLNSAKWNESDHPRDERGRFTSGGGGSGPASPGEHKSDYDGMEWYGNDGPDEYYDRYSNYHKVSPCYNESYTRNAIYHAMQKYDLQNGSTENSVEVTHFRGNLNTFRKRFADEMAGDGHQFRTNSDLSKLYIYASKGDDYPTMELSVGKNKWGGFEISYNRTPENGLS